MTYITKPRLHHPSLPKNKVGYTRRDYEGKVSTLCAGCGHDSISAALIEAFFELDIQPHRVAKLSGIGCSSKTPDYFLGNSHGFNTVHGRMPSVLTGANLANRDLIYLGVSGDGDSASIGLGQFAHVMRRGVNMTYILENNGVYGLTKGQFSATADKGSKAKKGATNKDSAIDTVSLALLMGATFVARSFSGDKRQLVPLVKAAIAHPGAAFIDVISPCVAFNNHPGSTKSYDYVREHNEAVNRLDFMEGREEITADYAAGTVIEVAQHDGSVIRLRKLAPDYDPADRIKVMNYLQERVIREALAQDRKHRWRIETSRHLTVAQIGSVVALAFLGGVLASLYQSAPPRAVFFALTGRSVVVTPGDTSVEKGSSLVVLARFNGDVPAEATLVVRPANEPESTCSLAFLTGTLPSRPLRAPLAERSAETFSATSFAARIFSAAGRDEGWMTIVFSNSSWASSSSTKRSW